MNKNLSGKVVGIKEKDGAEEPKIVSTIHATMDENGQVNCQLQFTRGLGDLAFLNLFIQKQLMTMVDHQVIPGPPQ